jgi:hypothetical protein
MPESRAMWRWTRIAYAMLWVATFVAFAISYVVMAPAQVQPVPRIGSCPSGFVTSGGYCMPMSGTTRPAIVKGGAQCPAGWTASGSNYCLGPAPKQ